MSKALSNIGFEKVKNTLLINDNICLLFYFLFI